MEEISINSAIAFSLLCVFMYYQMSHMKVLQKDKGAIYYLLWVSTMLGTLTGLGFLVYYGLTVAWHAPMVILMAGVGVVFLGEFLEKVVPPVIVSYLGFIGWPICAYLMFIFMPLTAGAM
jgi:hypothetical protein